MTRRHILFASCSLALLSVSSGPLRELMLLGRDNPTASHHVLVPLVTIALIYLDRAVIFRSTPARSLWIVVLAFLAGSSALWMLSAAAAVGTNIGLITRIAALTIVWGLAFWFTYGTASIRIAAFPLLFLVFMVPIPTPWIDSATQFLKTGSA